MSNVFNFSFQDGNPINVRKSSSGANSVVNRMDASDSDAYIDNDYIRYRTKTQPRLSWIHQNQLFGLNTGECLVLKSMVLIRLIYSQACMNAL